jgi:hypothetical protein
MEAGKVELIVGEGLAIELDQFTVPSLGELPHDWLRYFHFLEVYTKKTSIISK